MAFRRHFRHRRSHLTFIATVVLLLSSCCRLPGVIIIAVSFGVASSADSLPTRFTDFASILNGQNSRLRVSHPLRNQKSRLPQ